MAEIQGKYLLFAHVNNAAYTLTSANRSADFGITGAQTELIVKAITADAANAAIVCGVENEFRIKRIKIEANGGPGILAGVNHLAAQFELQCGRDDDGTFIIYDKRQINIPQWGEWFNVDLVIKPFNRLGNNNEYDFLGFSIDPATAVFYVDDYNLQADYISQGITPFIYMEVEAPGLYLRSNGQIF